MSDKLKTTNTAWQDVKAVDAKAFHKDLWDAIELLPYCESEGCVVGPGCCHIHKPPAWQAVYKVLEKHKLVSNDKDNKIKPCPFCGESVSIYPYYPDKSNAMFFKNSTRLFMIECNDCPAGVMEGFSSEKDAIAAWNRRVPLNYDKLRYELAKGFSEPIVDGLGRQSYSLDYATADRIIRWIKEYGEK